MKIIKSKYTSKELKERIEVGEKLIDTEILAKIKNRAKVYEIIHISVFLFFLPAMISFAVSASIALSLVPFVILTIYLALFVLAMILPTEYQLKEKYRKKNYILENPYDSDFQKVTYLIELGETLNRALEDEDNFLVIVGENISICSSKLKQTIKTYDFDDRFADKIIGPDYLDFSRLDDIVDLYIDDALSERKLQEG